MTSRAIEIRPPCPPIAKIPAFVRAKRRIYLTATLADDSVLVTDLDADPDLVRRPVTPGNAADLGERIILAPLELNPEVDEAAILDLARQYAAGDRDGDGVVDATPVNAVVLVPSDKVADKWRPFADRVCKVGDLAGTVGELRRGHVGLVVLVNKYDGVDLPGDACRLLVIDGVPRPLDGAERRELNALATSPAFKARYVQRLEQGMGRGVRDTDDHCVVLLLGTDLAMSLHDPAQRALLSPATKAQVALSRELAAQIAGEGMAAVRLAIDACLDRDTHWVQANRLALANVTYDEQSLVRPEAVAGRRAFELASAGKLADAAAELQRMVGTLNDRAQRGWLGEQRAAYVNAFDPVQAQHILSAAVEANPYVLRPVAGVPVTRIKPPVEQAKTSSLFLKREYGDSMSLVLGVRALLDDIQWDKTLTDQAEAAWERLGLHLGFGSDRPEKKYGTGPDNLWALTPTTHAVIELKTGCTTNTIAKKDVDQLGGSIRWHQEIYGTDVDTVPVMLHPSTIVDDRGTVVPGLRVITPPKLTELKTAVVGYVVALANNLGAWNNEKIVAQQLAHFGLNGNVMLNRFSLRAN